MQVGQLHPDEETAVQNKAIYKPQNDVLNAVIFTNYFLNYFKLSQDCVSWNVLIRPSLFCKALGDRSENWKPAGRHTQHDAGKS